MTNGQRTVAGLLAVVAVMLGLNLIVRGSPTAVAQEPKIRIFPEPPVRIINISTTWDNDFRRERVYRLWSDGVIEQNLRRSANEDSAWRGWQVVPEVPAP